MLQYLKVTLQLLQIKNMTKKQHRTVDTIVLGQKYLSRYLAVHKLPRTTPEYK